MIDPEKFQGEVMAWNSKNFPHAEKWMPLVGMTEEMGELNAAINANDVAATKDALGDVMVFAAVFCGFNGYNLYQLAQKECEEYPAMLWALPQLQVQLSIEVGKLSHAFLKDYQKIRQSERHRDVMIVQITNILHILESIANGYDFSLLECADAAWSHVKERDWIKYPKTGKPEASKKVAALMPERKVFTTPTSRWNVKGAKEYVVPKEKWSDEVPF